MNREDIIRMARESHGPLTGTWWDMDVSSLERFAALVASAEREACAKVCEDEDVASTDDAIGVQLCIAESIRARGQA